MAGLLSGLVEGLTWPDRLARAVALSRRPYWPRRPGEFDRAAYEELLSRVDVEEYAATTA